MKNLKNWTRGLRARLLLMVILPVVLLISAGVFSIYKIDQIQKSAEVVAREKLPKVLLINHIRRDVNITIRILLLAIESDSEALVKLGKELHDAQESAKSEMDEYQELKMSEKMAEIFKAIPPNWEIVEQKGQLVMAALASGTDEGRVRARKLITTEVMPPANQVLDASIKAEKQINERVEANIAESEALSRDSLRFTALFDILATLVMSVLGIMTARRLVGVLEPIAKQVNEMTVTLQSTSGSLSETSQALSQESSEQAAAVHETSSAMEQISAMVVRNVDGAKSSATIARESLGIADQGRRAVEKMMEDIRSIEQGNRAFVGHVDGINKELEKIAKIFSDIETKTGVIHDIVFQTKLLSFNASVEAARAGEHGKGFSVVAEEVGNLAVMSGNSAKEINDLLNQSRSMVTEIVQRSQHSIRGLMTDSDTRVRQGVQTAEQCTDMLSQIHATAEKLETQVKEIARASEEQARGVSEVNKAVHQISRATQKIVDSSTNSAQDAERLNRESLELNRIGATLVNTISGGGDQSGDRASDHYSDSHDSAAHSNAA